MQIIINLPDEVTAKMERKWGNLSQKVLNSLALESYQNQLITTTELRKILNLSSTLEVHQFLKESGIYLNYDDEELSHDFNTVSQLRKR
ncbi:MAG: UPF0175 family protein [Cyanobacterium sp. T60_A2020_053]|nr:UPF0175 family protein [Cyanobacterium sp. T60_A2020_053]